MRSPHNCDTDCPCTECKFGVMVSVLVRFVQQSSQNYTSVCMPGSLRSVQCGCMHKGIPELRVQSSTAVWYTAKSSTTSKSTSTGL